MNDTLIAEARDAFANLKYETLRINPIADPDEASRLIGALAPDFAALEERINRLVQALEEQQYEVERSGMACDTWQATYLRAKNRISELLGEPHFDPDLALEVYIERLGVAYAIASQPMGGGK